jgi:hypothetical protein
LLKVVRIGKISIPVPIIVISFISVVLAATMYTEMYGYLAVRRRPVAIWLSPMYYSLEVYTASVYHQLATIENNVENMTLELVTDIWGDYYDPEGYWHDLTPYIHVVYLDYENRVQLPDTDADGNPEIFSPVGTTSFYVQIILDEVPDLNYGYATIHTIVEEFA